MGKLLFMLLIAAIAWAFFKKRQRPGRTAADKSAETGKPPSSPSPAATATVERMVACGNCGVFMPESDSVAMDGKIGCRDPAHCAHRPS